MIACVVHPDPSNQNVNLLGQLLEKLGYSLVRKDSLEAGSAEMRLQSGHDNILLVPTTDDWRPTADSIVALAKSLRERAFIVFVCDEISPDDYKALLRTGSGDCVGWKKSPKEISEIIQRLRSEARKPPSHVEKKPLNRVIVGFLPAGGGVGNTTLALETGVHFSKQKDKDARRTAAVELDFNHGSMCEYVDLAPHLDITDLARNPRRLDDYMLDIFSSHHPSGMDLFSAVDPPADCSTIDGAAVFTLLNKLHGRYEVLLLDFPSYRPQWGDQALSNCDFVFITCRHSIPSLKYAARELKRLRDLGIEPARTAVVVTHCESSLFGGVTRKSEITAVLPGYRVICIRDDKSFALEAVNSGVSMMETNSGRSICREFREVADVVRSLAPRETV